MTPLPSSEPVLHPRYRAYCESLSAASDSFLDVREWADLISALQKVQRVLDLKGKFRPDATVAVTPAGGGEPMQLSLSFIPRALSINLAKRLAQCLNSGLPSGVHLKALEVYELVLARLGNHGLVSQLSIWTLGLLGLQSHASSRVKPVLLGLIERFYLPLGPKLLPALPGLLMALLPGMEEDSSTSDTREKVLEILEALRMATRTRLAGVATESVFMNTLWKLLLNVPGVRLAAVNYLTAMLPKPTALLGAHGSTVTLALSRFVSHPPSLCIAALLAALHSRENVMTQRKGLELVLSHFPLKEPHSTLAHSSAAPASSPNPGAGGARLSVSAPPPPPLIGSVFEIEDQVALLSGALDILLLNDVSLSRRTFTWLTPASAAAPSAASHNKDDAAAPTVTLPDHSLRLLHMAFMRMIYEVVPELALAQESGQATAWGDWSPAAIASAATAAHVPAASILDSPDLTPAATVAILLRPFRLLSVLLERDEIARSPLLSLLHLPLLRYLFEVRDRLEDESVAAQQAAARDAGSDRTNLTSSKGRSSSSRKLLRLGAASPAMDAVLAFYSHVPVAPVWAVLVQRLQEAHAHLQDVQQRQRRRHTAASPDEHKNAPSLSIALVPIRAHEMSLSDAECDELRGASARLDLCVRLLDLASDVLPIPSSSVSSLGLASVNSSASLSSLGGLGAGGLATPASVLFTPSTLRTPIGLTPMTPLVPRGVSAAGEADVDLLPIVHELMLCAFALADLQAFPHVNFVLQTLLTKMMPMMREANTANEAAFSLPSPLPPQLLDELLHRLPSFMQSSAAQLSVQQQLWSPIFDASLMHDCSLKCVSLLLNLCDACLHVPAMSGASAAAAGSTHHPPPSPPRSWFRQADTPPLSVPPSPHVHSFTLASRSVSGVSIIQHPPAQTSHSRKGSLSIRVGAGESATVSPPVIAAVPSSSPPSQLCAVSADHLRLLRSYHAQLFSMLHCPQLDYSLAGILHWINLVECYGAALFAASTDLATTLPPPFSSAAVAAGSLSQSAVLSFVLRKLWSFLHASFSHAHAQVGEMIYRLLRLEARLLADETTADQQDQDQPLGPSCIEQISLLVLHPPHRSQLLDGYSKLMCLWRLLVDVELERSWSAGVLVATSPSESRSVSASSERTIAESTQAWLWILLDALDDFSPDMSSEARPPQLRLLAKAWLKGALTLSFTNVIDPLLSILLHPHTARRPNALNAAAGSLAAPPLYAHVFDVRRLLFALHTLQRIVSVESGVFAEQAMRTKPSAQALAWFAVLAPAADTAAGSSSNASSAGPMSSPTMRSRSAQMFGMDATIWTQPRTYLQLLCFALLHFVRARFPEEAGGSSLTSVDDAQQGAVAALRAQSGKVRSVATDLLQFLASSIPITTVSVQMCSLIAPQVLLALAQCTGLKQRTSRGQPAQDPASAVFLPEEHDPVMQLQLLSFLRVLLLESHRRVDFTDPASGSASGSNSAGGGPGLSPTHALFAHPLFAQTVLAGIKAASPLARIAPYAKPAPPIARPASSSPVSGDAPLPLGAKATIAALSLLPHGGRIKSFFPYNRVDEDADPSDQEESIAGSTPITVPTLVQWLGFVQTVLPLMRTSLHTFASAVITAICSELTRCSAELARVAPSGALPPQSGVGHAAVPQPSPAQPLCSPQPGQGFSRKQIAALSARGHSSAHQLQLLSVPSSSSALQRSSSPPAAAAAWTHSEAARRSVSPPVDSAADSCIEAVASHSTLAASCTDLLDGLRAVLFFCLARDKAGGGVDSHFNPAVTYSIATEDVPAASADAAAKPSAGVAEAKSESTTSSMLNSFTSVFSSSASKPAVRARASGIEAQTREAVYALLPSVIDALLGVWSLAAPDVEPDGTVLATPQQQQQTASARISGSSTPSTQTAFDQSSSVAALSVSSNSHTFTSPLLLASSSRHQWIWLHRDLHVWVLRLVEGLLARSAAATLSAVAQVWERALADVVQGRGAPEPLSSTAAPPHSELDDPDLSAPFDALHLAPKHHLILGLLNALPAAIASPELLVSALVPLTMVHIAKAAPHQRTHRTAVIPSFAPAQQPSPNNTGGSGAGPNTQAASAPSSSSVSQQVSVLVPLSDSEHGALHLLYHVLKHTRHTHNLPAVWSNKDGASAGSGAVVAPTDSSSSSAPSAGLSLLFSSTQIQSYDHPFVLLWLLSILQVWIRRSQVFHSHTRATSSASKKKGEATPSTSKGVGASSAALASLSASLDAERERSGEPNLDKKTLREVQNNLHNLLSNCAGFVSESIEISLPSHAAEGLPTWASVLGVNVAALPPALHFIAPRNEMTDLVPPLPPWLDVVAEAAIATQPSQHPAAKLHAHHDPVKHPSWPHLQVTVPQSAREWKRLLYEQIPVATGSLLHQPLAPRLQPSSGLRITAAEDSSPAKRSRALFSKSVATSKSATVSVSLVMLRCLSNVLAPLLLDAFHGGPGLDAHIVSDYESRGVSLLSAILPLLLPALQHHHPLNLPFVTPVVSLLASLSTPGMAFTFRAWRKDCWEHFFSSNDGLMSSTNGVPPAVAVNGAPLNNTAAGWSSAVPSTAASASPGGFFCTDVVSLSQLRWVLSRILSEDASLLNHFFHLSDHLRGGALSINLGNFASSMSGGLMSSGSSGFSLGFSAGLGGLFGSREAELCSRRSSLKKLSFLLHAGRKDQYARHLPAILERIIENLKITASAVTHSADKSAAATAANAGAPGGKEASQPEQQLVRSINALHSQVFLCLRVLLARVSAEHLASVWPIVLMELIRIFTGSSSKSNADPSLLHAACKWIDIALCLLPAQFVLFSWMFVREPVEEFVERSIIAAGGTVPPQQPQPSASPQAPGEAAPAASPNSNNSQHAGATFQPHVQHLEEHDASRASSVHGGWPRSAASAVAVAAASSHACPLLRPVLLSRHVSSLSELSSFHARLSTARSASFAPQCVHTASHIAQPPLPDLAFVDALLLSDLCEFPEIEAPVTVQTVAGRASPSAESMAASSRASPQRQSAAASPSVSALHLGSVVGSPLASPDPPAPRALTVNPSASPIAPHASAATAHSSGSAAVTQGQASEGSARKPPLASPATHTTRLHQANAQQQQQPQLRVQRSSASALTLSSSSPPARLPSAGASPLAPSPGAADRGAAPTPQTVRPALPFPLLVSAHARKKSMGQSGQ